MENSAFMKTSLYGFAALLVMACGCSNEKNIGDAFGNFEATEVIVSSQVSGIVTSATVDEGDEVSLGQVLCTVDSLQNVLKLDQLKGVMDASQSRIETIDAQVAVLKAQKQTLEKDFARVAAMYKDGAATQRDYDNVSGQLDVVNKQIVQTKSQVAAIRGDLKSIQSQELQVEDLVAKARVVSPIAGTVLDKYVQAGELASPGKQLYRIADIKNLTLKVYVSGAQLPKVVIGSKVAVYVDKNADENTKLSGVVSWVSPQAEFTPKIIQTKEERVDLVYAVKVLVVNDGSLKIGMPGSIVF